MEHSTSLTLALILVVACFAHQCSAKPTNLALVELADPFVCPPLVVDFFPLDPIYCSQFFYFCVNGNYTTEKCSGSNFFDPTTKTCKSTANCLIESSTESISTSKAVTTDDVTSEITFTEGPLFVCPQQPGFYPMDENICSQDFYACQFSGSEPVLSKCPESFVFDPLLKMCVASDQCLTTTSSSSSTITSTTSSPSTVFTTVTPTSTTTSSTSSTTSTTTPSPVSSTLVSSTVTPTSITTSSTISTSRAPTTTASAFSCAGRSNGNYPSAICSSIFYQCSNGITWSQNCQPGLIFDTRYNVCNYPSSVPGCN